MGKRKFENEKGESPKKPKKNINIETDYGNNEQPQNDDHTGDEEKQRNPRGFDVKHFRKELAGKQGQTMVLTQFLQVCLNPDNEVDYMLEYLKCGGNSHEILRQITPDSKKNLTLATPAFHLFHLVIVKVQSSLPHMITITEEACRYFLNTFMSTLEIMISDSSSPRHRKVVLKLLTSMVTLNSDLGIEILNQAPLTPKHLQHIVEKPNYKEKDNVRTCFVHFMTSFLVEGHLPLIKALLEKHGLLGLIIPGLVHDEAEAVLMFLNILKANVIDNTLVSKSLKLKTFNQHMLHNMFKIFSWRGPPEINYASKNEARLEIIALLSDILVTLFTNNKIGLHFIDSSLGMTEINKNPNLYKALLSLKRPWENESESEVILGIIYKCPDLHRAIISVIEQSFEPKHSPIWERAVDFTVKLLNKLKPENITAQMANLPPPQMANFVRFITLPVPLLKFIQANLEKDQIISLYCVKVLVKMLQTLKRYMQILEANISTIPISDLKNRLEYFLPKHMPTPTVVVTLIEDIIAGKGKSHSTKDYTLPKIGDTDALISLIDLLLLYNDIHPTFFETLEGTIDMKKILDYSVTLSDGNVSLLKFKVVSLWLILDSTVISLKNPMFKELLRIMLDVYARDDDSTCVEAKDTLRTFFKSTGIFETDEDEIDLILYTLRNSKWDPPSLIGDVVEYVLENIKDLSDYVKSQLVNFEIVDQNCATSLDKLFGDLMENRINEDSTFLENKVPSPFIVGCIQYYQLNKDDNTNLKPFLSLYVVNLLHSNYSPELTEVLMGDCKLDARAYVGSWTGQPVALSDAIADEPLVNISKSLIQNEDLPLTNIFPFLKESTTEDSEIVINDNLFKFDIDINFDSSELLIWAKYLIFCIVRLSDMGQLTQKQQTKIRDYFQCIIAVGRKHHKVDICRTIILNVLKNPHVLKSYKPLDLNKGAADLLATQFILQVINDNKDIINYLNNKEKVLKSYQQKNYNEIVKAFIKINKKKNINANHTINVLETVGLANEDDVRVFKEVFNTEASNSVRDDKEPSLVLELMSNLIDKYSKTVALELQPQILRKCMILYTELLTNKEINANLSKLESSLAQYFENKPHQVNKVSDELFKKFFEATTIRKTTSHLAYVLLKNNMKLCNTFKVHVVKPEILSQRELALPLGSAIVTNKSFLLENQQLLVDYYNVYKSNIIKMLEKPHKAGQIYIANSKFIRKLILECMDFQECAKLFSKTHKFESVELSHVHLMQTIFLKLCTSEMLQKDHLIHYYSSMLHLSNIALKEGNEVQVVNEIITNIYRVVQISKTVQTLSSIEKEEFKKVTQSALWQNFCKSVLKDSLRVKTIDQGLTSGPQLLCLLTHLVKLFYPLEHDDIGSLFDIVTSHSEFLNVMLSYHSSEIKSRLVEFLYTLIRMNKSVMKTQQIPVYLSSYHATRSPCDRLILAILYHYETSGLPVNEFKPYVWGDSGANYYAVRKSRTSSLWAHPSPNQVLNLFEKDIIEKTVRNFPVTQKLDYHYELPLNICEIDNESVRNILDKMSGDGVFRAAAAKDIEGAVNSLALKGKYAEAMEILRKPEIVLCVSHETDEDGVYDPLFVLPLLGHLLAPGSAASCFRLVRTGLLALPVAALAAHCPRVRAAACHVLHRFCMLLETETRHKNDKLFLTDFISTLRRSIPPSPEGEGASPRLPAAAAQYLARALLASTAPADPLYKPVNNFLIAKQVLDLTIVPDFLSLFHDSDVEASDRRMWILDVVGESTRTTHDLNVVFKTMCIKMIMDYYSSVLSDKKTKEKILNVIGSMVAVPRAYEILLEGYGLISWLHAVGRHIKKQDRSLAKGVLNIVRNIICSMKLNSLAKSASHRNSARPGKSSDFPELKINKEIENELLVILYDSFRSVDGLEAPDVVEYLKVFNLMTKRTIKNLSKNQVVSVVNAAGALNDCECVSLLNKSLAASDCNMIKSKIVDSTSEGNRLLQELIMFVQAYLV